MCEAQIGVEIEAEIEAGTGSRDAAHPLVGIS